MPRVVAPLVLAFASLGLGCVAATGGDADHAALHGVDETQEGYGAESASGPVAIGAKFTTTADLNLRKSASTSGTILDVVAKGSSVTAVASSPTNGFYQVSHAGTVGFMFGAYLNKVASSGGGGTSSTWSCTGSYGTTQPSDGKYDLTAFGCWTDASGVKHGDSGDNCIPG